MWSALYLKGSILVMTTVLLLSREGVGQPTSEKWYLINTICRIGIKPDSTTWNLDMSSNLTFKGIIEQNRSVLHLSDKQVKWSRFRKVNQRIDLSINNPNIVWLSDIPPPSGHIGWGAVWLRYEFQLFQKVDHLLNCWTKYMQRSIFNVYKCSTST